MSCKINFLTSQLEVNGLFYTQTSVKECRERKRVPRGNTESEVKSEDLLNLFV